MRQSPRTRSCVRQTRRYTALYGVIRRYTALDGWTPPRPRLVTSWSKPYEDSAGCRWIIAFARGCRRSLQAAVAVQKHRSRAIGDSTVHPTRDGIRPRGSHARGHKTADRRCRTSHRSRSRCGERRRHKGEPQQAAASSPTPGTVTIIGTGAVTSAGPTDTTATNANCGRSASGPGGLSRAALTSLID